MDFHMDIALIPIGGLYILIDDLRHDRCLVYSEARV